MSDSFIGHAEVRVLPSAMADVTVNGYLWPWSKLAICPNENQGPGKVVFMQFEVA